MADVVAGQCSWLSALVLINVTAHLLQTCPVPLLVVPTATAVTFTERWASVPPPAMPLLYSPASPRHSDA